MFEFVVNRLKEKSTRAGLIGAIAVVGGFTVPDEKIAAISYLVAFLAGLAASAMKENGSPK